LISHHGLVSFWPLTLSRGAAPVKVTNSSVPPSNYPIGCNAVTNRCAANRLIISHIRMKLSLALLKPERLSARTQIESGNLQRQAHFDV
jgi:hypothetical protein